MLDTHEKECFLMSEKQSASRITPVAWVERNNIRIQNKPIHRFFQK